MSLNSLHFHVVFSTKERRPLLVPAIRKALHAYIGGIVREMGGKAVIVNGTTDHVHILMELPGRLAIADCIRVIKTNSSRWLNQKGIRFAWQGEYSAFTVSTSNLPVLVKYIRDQEKHHQKRDSREELRSLLKKHGIDFDERFI